MKSKVASLPPSVSRTRITSAGSKMESRRLSAPIPRSRVSSPASLARAATRASACSACSTAPPSGTVWPLHRSWPPAPPRRRRRRVPRLPPLSGTRAAYNDSRWLWPSEHTVRVGSFFGDGLDDVPVLDDLAVLELEDVDDGVTARARLPDGMDMDDDVVALGEHALDFAAR